VTMFGFSMPIKMGWSCSFLADLPAQLPERGFEHRTLGPGHVSHIAHTPAGENRPPHVGIARVGNKVAIVAVYQLCAFR
jgi:hypothetical protein